MIKARAHIGGTSILILGLSEENRKRLGKDMPILITAQDLIALGFPGMEIAIVGGDTEESIMSDLHKAGFKNGTN